MVCLLSAITIVADAVAINATNLSNKRILSFCFCAGVELKIASVLRSVSSAIMLCIFVFVCVCVCECEREKTEFVTRERCLNIDYGRDNWISNFIIC